MKEKSNDFLDCMQNKSDINYKITNRPGKKNISISLNTKSSNKYNLKIKFVPVSAFRNGTLNLDKYNKFENIFIKLR